MKPGMQPVIMQFRRHRRHLPVGQTLPQEVPAAKPACTIPAINFNQATGLFDMICLPLPLAEV